MRPQADEATKQRYKRRLLAKWYDAEVAAGVEAQLAWVRQREQETVVQLKSGSRLRDTGETITAQKTDTAALRLQMEMAKAKGWEEITVSGTDGYKRAAAYAATVAGLRVTNAELQGIIGDAKRATAVEQQALGRPAAEGYPRGATEREKDQLQRLRQTAKANTEHGNDEYAASVELSVRALEEQIKERERQRVEAQQRSDVAAPSSGYQSGRRPGMRR